MVRTMRREGHFLPLLQQPGADSTGWLRQEGLQDTPGTRPAAALCSRSPCTVQRWSRHPDPFLDLAPFPAPHLLSTYCAPSPVQGSQTQARPSPCHTGPTLHPPGPLKQPPHFPNIFSPHLGPSLHLTHQPQMPFIQRTHFWRSPGPSHSAASSAKWVLWMKGIWGWCA